MGQYRPTRNIEASIIQFLETELTNAGFLGIAVEKTFARIFELDSKVPGICVRISDTNHIMAEIGGTGTYRIPLVLIDIFALSDGQRLDVKDFLISILKNGLPFFEYTITSGVVSGKTQNGRIKVTDILDTIVNLNVDKSKLDIHDRYRHTLSLTVELGKVEA